MAFHSWVNKSLQELFFQELKSPDSPLFTNSDRKAIIGMGAQRAFNGQ
jgi:hypothetical protein